MQDEIKYKHEFYVLSPLIPQCLHVGITVGLFDFFHNKSELFIYGCISDNEKIIKNIIE